MTGHAAAAPETVIAVRSWQRSLLTLVTLVGVWAIFHGVSEIFAAFTVRQAGKRVEQTGPLIAAERASRRTGRAIRTD